MKKSFVAIASTTVLVCAPAAWADVPYLGGTGQQGPSTEQHPDYGGLDLANLNAIAVTTIGNITHIVVKTDDRPITRPLRDFGVDDIVVDAGRLRPSQARSEPYPARRAAADRRA